LQYTVPQLARSVIICSDQVFFTVYLCVIICVCLMQNVHFELEERQLELDKLVDDGVALMELSGREEQVTSSIAHARDRYDALTTAVSVSD